MMCTWLLRFIAPFASVLMLALGFGTQSYAGFGVYQPSRYYASPFGEVRWFDAAPGLLLVSDLRRSVAAIDVQTGAIKWTHTAVGGRLDNVWKSGEYLIVAGVDVEVLDRSTGKILWDDILSCPTGGICASRVLSVDNQSVFFTGTGEVHSRMWRLGLNEGRPLWKESAPVRHPKRLFSNTSQLVVQESLSPFALRWLDKATGSTTKQWSWPQTKGPRPSNHVRVTDDGTVMAIQLRPGDGSLAKVARLSSKHSQVLSVEGNDRLPTHAVWAYATKNSFFGLVPDPRGDGGSLVRKKLTAKELDISRSQVIDTPKIIGSQAIVHTHDGRDSIITGYDTLSTQKMFTSRIATPTRRARIIPAAGLAIVVMKGAPRPFLVVAPEQKKLLGVGSIVQSSTKIHKAMNIGANLYVAEGKGVQGYALRTLDHVTARLTRLLEDAEIEDALQTWSSISLLAGTAPSVTRWLPKIAAQRYLVLRHRLEENAVTDVLQDLAEELSLTELRDPVYLRPRLRALASFLADELLHRAERFRPTDLGHLLRATGHVQKLIQRHLSNTSDAGFREDFGSVAMSLATTLVQANAFRAAADLLATWRSTTSTHPRGFEALYRRISLHALEHLFKSVHYDLESSEDGIRRPAAHLLNAFPHTVAAIGLNLNATVNKVLSKDHNRARAAGTELVDVLRTALRNAASDAGKGLTKPGCTAVCEAIGTTCLNRCRQPRDCSSAVKTCKKRCSRRHTVRWKAPQGIPTSAQDNRICD